MNNNPYVLPIVLSLAVIFLIMWVLKSRACSQLISENLELKKLHDRISKKELRRLKSGESASSSEDGSSGDESEKAESDGDRSSESKESGKSKKKASEDSSAVSELKDKVRGLKSENAKLKEKNYNLSKDNESLRVDIRTNASSSVQGQREIIGLREERDHLAVEAAEAKSRIAELEKQLDGAKSGVPQKIEVPEIMPSGDSERVKQLECENASLAASLKDVRGELLGFKRDFKAQLDAAKAEVAESNRALKKELNVAQRRMAQSKKRADNNHQVYLIARAQMLLAEKRLQKHDPSYKSMMSLPASNDAIEEIIKKFVSFDAREKRASVHVLHKDKAIDELNERVKQLESENAALKSQNTASGALHLDDDSFGSFSSLFADDAKDVKKNETPSLVGLDAGNLADIDLSSLDDGWESV